MAIYEGSTNVVSNYQTAEYGKFVKLTDNTNFPAISVTRLSYADGSNAFNNQGNPPLTAIDIYPKYAVLSHITNPGDISQIVNISGSNVAINLAPLTATNTTLASLLTNNQALLAQEAQSFIALSAIDLNTFDAVTAINMFNQDFSTIAPILTANTCYGTISSKPLFVTNPVPSLIRSFNNFGINSNAGFHINSTKIPVFAIRVNPNSGVTGFIRNYEILANATGGTFALGYTWVYNPTAIGGSYTWNTLLSSNLQYAIFDDQNGTPNSYSGGVTVHTGLVVESNIESGDEMSDFTLQDNSSPTVLLLAAQRLDSASPANFWFAVDVAQN